jgi:hypothetical protein
MEVIEEFYELANAEIRQFLWRNIILRNYTKEEIILKRALTVSAIYDLIAQSTQGFQVFELDVWITQNLFKRGLRR